MAGWSATLKQPSPRRPQSTPRKTVTGERRNGKGVCWLFALGRSPIRVVLCGLGGLCVEFCASTYINRRLWITFWSQFGGVFWGGFWEPTGLGAGVRGDFSTDARPMVRWASANLVPFSTFFAFLDRFLPVFGPYFALFPSMPCAYLYVHNFPRTRVSGEGKTAQPSTQRTQRTQRGDWGTASLSA
jgi:hypothetical protein